jgi:hypothetical protein
MKMMPEQIAMLAAGSSPISSRVGLSDSQYSDRTSIIAVAVMLILAITDFAIGFLVALNFNRWLEHLDAHK